MVTKEELIEIGFEQVTDGQYSLKIGENNKGDRIYLAVFTDLPEQKQFFFLTTEKNIGYSKNHVDIWRTEFNVDELKQLCVLLGHGTPYQGN